MSRLLPRRREPRVGVLLARLWPSELEADFWQSECFRCWLVEVDAVNIALRLLEGLLAHRMWQELPKFGVDASHLHRVSWHVTWLAALHLGFRMLMGPLYRRFRLALALHMRLCTLLVLVLLAQELRRLPHRHPLLLPHILNNPNHQLLIHPYFTFRAVLAASLAFHSCLHALPPTLPFALTLPIQLAYLVTIFRLVAVPFTDFASHPTFLPHVQTTCHLLSRNLHRPFPFLLQPHLRPSGAICHTRQATWVMVLLAQLFFGCVLPLYITYITERRLKLSFLCQSGTSTAGSSSTTTTTRSSTSPPTASTAITTTSTTTNTPAPALTTTTTTPASRTMGPTHTAAAPTRMHLASVTRTEAVPSTDSVATATTSNAAAPAAASSAVTTTAANPTNPSATVPISAATPAAAAPTTHSSAVAATPAEPTPAPSAAAATSAATPATPSAAHPDPPSAAAAATLALLFAPPVYILLNCNCSPASPPARPSAMQSPAAPPAHHAAPPAPHPGSTSTTPLPKPLPGCYSSTWLSAAWAPLAPSKPPSLAQASSTAHAALPSDTGTAPRGTTGAPQTLNHRATTNPSATGATPGGSTSQLSAGWLQQLQPATATIPNIMNGKRCSAGEAAGAGHGYFAARTCGRCSTAHACGHCSTACACGTCVARRMAHRSSSTTTTTTSSTTGSTSRSSSSSTTTISSTTCSSATTSATTSSTSRTTSQTSVSQGSQASARVPHASNWHDHGSAAAGSGRSGSLGNTDSTGSTTCPTRSVACGLTEMQRWCGATCRLRVHQLETAATWLWRWLWSTLQPDQEHTSRFGRCIALVRRRSFDAVALWALAAVSWQLVLAAHVPVLRYARPLDFVGGDKRWYWELLCGSDQPCCHAP